MENHYDKIKNLVELDEHYNNSTVSLHLNKLTEEVGEFAQVINKTLGIKKKSPDDTQESIKDDMCEEASDAIQIIVGICALNGISYKELMTKLEEKNLEYEKFIWDKKK